MLVYGLIMHPNKKKPAREFLDRYPLPTHFKSDDLTLLAALMETYSAYCCLKATHDTYHGLIGQIDVEWDKRLEKQTNRLQEKIRQYEK